MVSQGPNLDQLYNFPTFQPFRLNASEIPSPTGFNAHFYYDIWYLINFNTRLYSEVPQKDLGNLGKNAMTSQSAVIVSSLM